MDPSQNLKRHQQMPLVPTSFTAYVNGMQSNLASDIGSQIF